MISLVIPTYNRPQFVKRLLDYYSRLAFPHTILVADSSSPNSVVANQEIVKAAQKKLTIRYEQFGSEISIPSKIAQMLAKVDSNYSAICADDDFIVPQAIEKCARFLGSNPDCVVAHGRLLSMYPLENRFTSQPAKLWTLNRSPRTIDSSSPRQRLLELSKCEGTLFYSVHRRLNLMRNMQLASTISYHRDFTFQALLLESLTVIQGKLGYLDILYGVRPLNPQSESYDDPSLRWGGILTSANFTERYLRFRSLLVDELVRVAGTPVEEAKETVDHAFLVLVTKALYGEYGKMIDGAAPYSRKAMRILAVQGQSMLQNRRLAPMIRRLLELARRAYLERNLSPERGYMPVNQLLDPHSPFFVDFLPIYQSAILGHPGDAVENSN